MKSNLIRADETRYTYEGSDLGKWFDDVPLHTPGRDAIWALATGNDGKIYIGLAGEHNKGTAALAAYDPKTGKTRIVCDVGQFLGEPTKIGRMPHSKIHFAICPHGPYIWFGTHISGAFGRDDLHGPIGQGPIADAVTGYEGGRLFRYDTRSDTTEQFGVVVPAEGIRCMKLTPDARYAYGISYPKHRFFMRDLTNGETYVSARIGKFGGIEVFIDAKGKVWGCHDGYEGTRSGQMYYFDPATRRLVDVEGLELPRSSSRRMSFPDYGCHILHMTPTPDAAAVISSYGESRISLLDPYKKRLYDWGSVWLKPPQQKAVAAEKDKPARQGKGGKPDFAWSTVFDPAGRTIEGKKYDRLMWYGEERWEYQEDVRLCAIAYNHSRPDKIVKIRFGTPLIGKYPAGHWPASTVGLDGRIYFADRVRDPKTPDQRKYVQLRLAILTPPKEITDLVKV